MFESLANRYLSYSRASLWFGLLLFSGALVVYGLQSTAAYTPVVPEALLTASVLYVIGGLSGFLPRMRGIPLLSATIVIILTFLWGSGALILAGAFGIL